MFSLLRYSSGAPLHLVILTDTNSIRGVAELLASLLGRYLAEVGCRPGRENCDDALCRA